MFCVAIALLVKIAVNLILIPRAGYLAACWAAILSDAVHYWMGMFFLKRIGFIFNNVKLIGIPALGGFLSAVCLLLTRWSPSIIYTFSLTILAVVVYTGTIYISKYIKKEEILSLIRPASKV